MKKKIACLFIGALAALVMMMPVYADEMPTDETEGNPEEIVTEAEEEGSETTEEGSAETEETPDAETDEEPETEAETEAEAEPETDPSVETEAVPSPETEQTVEPNTEIADQTVEKTTDDEWEAFKSKITDTATWTMIGAALMTILTTVGTIKSSFDKISSLVNKKADDEAVKDALKEAEEHLKQVYNEKHDEIAKVLQRYENALKNTDENEQKLYAILTLFMTNCKISDSAKAEILNILADVKKYDGNVGDMVEKAQDAIDAAIKNAKENSLPTPTLDRMLEEDYMELG